MKFSLFTKLLHLPVAPLGFLFRALLLCWSTLAIHYSNLPWLWARNALAAAFLISGIWALWIAPRKRGTLIFAAAFLALIAWWLTILPSHDRPWRPEVAVMPRAVINGDHIIIENFRNFDYRSKDDFTPHYEKRDYLLSHLTGVDFYISYWREGPVGHTFLSFLFDNAPPLCISIEARPEVGEGFDPIDSMFKQFELIYVVGDERDIVRVRTNFRNEEVFLYRLNDSATNGRKLLLVYLNRINELADRAEFYNLLTNNCTLNIIRYMNAAGREGSLDIRHLLNGWIDSYLYLSGRIDTTLPFQELRRRSHINERARAAGGSLDFSDRIRAGLPSIDSSAGKKAE